MNIIFRPQVAFGWFSSHHFPGHDPSGLWQGLLGGGTEGYFSSGRAVCADLFLAMRRAKLEPLVSFGRPCDGGNPV